MYRLFLMLTLALSLSLRAADSTQATVVLRGRVLRPADYVLNGDERDLYHLILKAGGPVLYVACGGERVMIARNRGKSSRESQSYRIDVAKLMKEGPTSEMNHEVRDGDLVVVLENGL